MFLPHADQHSLCIHRPEHWDTVPNRPVIMNETQTGIRRWRSLSSLCSAKRAAIKLYLPHRLTEPFPCPISAIFAFHDSLLHVRRHPNTFGQVLSFHPGFLEFPLHRSDDPPGSLASCSPMCTHLHPPRAHGGAPAPFASPCLQAPAKLFWAGVQLYKKQHLLGTYPLSMLLLHHHGNPAVGDGLLGNTNTQLDHTADPRYRDPGGGLVLAEMFLS